MKPAINNLATRLKKENISFALKGNTITVSSKFSGIQNLIITYSDDMYQLMDLNAHWYRNKPADLATTVIKARKALYA